MSKLGPAPYRRVERALRRFGFTPTRQKGSHVFYEHADGRVTVVPKHPREPIGPGMLRQIARDIRIDPEEFKKLL